MKEISTLADNYISFGIVLTDILERNHITHNQLREAAHYGNNILTDIKAGIPKHLDHYNRTLHAAYSLRPHAEALRLYSAACRLLIQAPD